MSVRHQRGSGTLRSRCGNLAVTALVLTGFLWAAVPAVVPTLAASAQAAEPAVYRLPDQAIVDIIDARRTPAVRVSPDRAWLLLADRPSLPSIAELSQRELGLAGTRFKPATNGPSQTWPAIGLTFLRVSDGEQRPVRGLPENPRLENLTWSPDGTRVAFTQTTPSGIELWVADKQAAPESAWARRLTGPKVSLVAGMIPTWMPDGTALIAALVPGDRGPEPVAPTVPTGPVVQENLGRTAPARTIPDLLQSPYDEKLFEHYFTTRLARIDLRGAIHWIGAPALFSGFDPSPDGQHLFVQVLHPPYSYTVPLYRFPSRMEVWDLAGRREHLVADVPLQEEVPISFSSVETGPRDVGWRSDAPATLCWTEALDGGDAGRQAELRDAVFLHAAPFDGEPVLWIRLPIRCAGILWGSGDLALISGRWWKTRNSRTWRARPDAPDTAAELLQDRSWEDAYNDPGVPVTVPNQAGRPVLLTRAGRIFLLGEGASPEGNRPFLDEYDPGTKETRRLFRSEAPFYERPVAVLDTTAGLILTTRESPEEVPNFHVRDLAGGEPRRLTSFPHPYPGLRGITKELVRYRRADGVPLSGTLFLPAGYRPEDGPLPTLLWAYPQEFKSADAAGQITDSPYRFDWVGWSSPLVFLTRGYAVLDDPKLPIVGEGDRQPNDTFVEQLSAGAKAAVDELVRRGVTDPRRVAIGGHSYGAFMTVNLLAHTDLFAAGLARTGGYNRTLTPFGFQSEERTLWQAPETYFAMSPFMFADKIKAPLLLIHGQADDNPGTFPMQSERLYAAMKGHGATVRLVLLPHEMHSYHARESAMHVLWETQEWLNRFVRKP